MISLWRKLQAVVRQKSGRSLNALRESGDRDDESRQVSRQKTNCDAQLSGCAIQMACKIGKHEAVKAAS